MFSFFLLNLLMGAFAFGDSPIQVLNGPIKDPSASNKWEAVIQVSGAVGETRSVILKIPAGIHGQIHWQKPAVSNLSHQETKIALFLMDQVLITRSSFSNKSLFHVFDPLIPIEENRIFLADRELYYWLDIEIPQGAKDHQYPTHLKIGEIPILVDFQILNWELPKELSLPAYIELNPWFISLAHFGGWDEREESLSAKYFEILRAHRFSTTKSWREGVEWTKSGIKRYLEANKHVFDQTLQSIAFDLPVPKPKDSLQSKISELTTMEEWLQSQQPRNYFIYFLDEPTPAQLEQSLAEIQFIKKYAPSVKIMITTEPTLELAPYIDIFVPVLNYYSAHWPRLNDHEVWWYISCMSHGCGEDEDPGVPDFVLDRPESYLLSIGPLTWQKKLDGFLYFHANYNFQFAPKKDPWTDLNYFSGNGDGDLFYPGIPGTHFSSIHQPIPSIRLKLWRETSYLHEYLSLLHKIAPNSALLQEVDQDFNSVFSWPRSTDYYIDIRQRLLKEINNHLHKY